MNSPLAGLIAGIPVALAAGLSLWLRSKSFVPELKGSNEEMAGWSDPLVAWTIIGSAALAGLLLGLPAGWIYGSLFVTRFAATAGLAFAATAVAGAVALTTLAMVTRTSMLVEKIMLHFIFALGYGLLIPLLVG